MKLENNGGRLLKMLGVARERMGVVRDSVLVVVWLAMGGAGPIPPPPPPPTAPPAASEAPPPPAAALFRPT